MYVVVCDDTGLPVLVKGLMGSGCSQRLITGSFYYKNVEADDEDGGKEISTVILCVSSEIDRVV